MRINQIIPALKRTEPITRRDNPDISGTTKLKIVERFRENVEPLDKMKFIGMGMKYKILQNWTDVNDWLRTSFGNLILK